MREVFLASLLVFAFGMGLFIFLMIQARKFRRSQGVDCLGTESVKTVTIRQINNNLKKLPANKLAVVNDFVAYLTEKEIRHTQHATTQPVVSEMVLLDQNTASQ